MKSYYGRPIETHQRSFERYYPRPPSASSCVGIARDRPNFWVPPIISGSGKATDFKFCTHIHAVNHNKGPWKILRNVAVGIVRDRKSRKFSEHPLMGRFAIAQLSCFNRLWLTVSNAWLKSTKMHRRNSFLSSTPTHEMSWTIWQTLSDTHLTRHASGHELACHQRMSEIRVSLRL